MPGIWLIKKLPIAERSRMLQGSGCRLRRLVVFHPDALDLARLLGNLETVVFDTGPAALRAEFETPHGPRVLE